MRMNLTPESQTIADAVKATQDELNNPKPKKRGPKPGWKKKREEEGRLSGQITVTHVEPDKPVNTEQEIKIKCPSVANDPSLNIRISFPEDVMKKLIETANATEFKVSLNDLIIAAVDYLTRMTPEQRNKEIVARDDIFQNIICPYMEARDVHMVMKLSLLKQMGYINLQMPGHMAGHCFFVSIIYFENRLISV